MESENYIFKPPKINLNQKSFSKKLKNQDISICSKYMSSKNLSISITKNIPVQLPEISRTQAMLSYMQSYKNLEKINDRVSHSNINPSPIISYLNKVKSNGLVPSTIGLLKKDSNENSLDISHYSIGNSYADALSEGLKYTKISKLILKNNRLTDKGADDLIKNLNPEIIIEIDLSENLLGLKAVIGVCRISEFPNSKLKILKLDSNNLGDRLVILLCSVLSNSDKIIELSLADNNIGEYAASSIASYLKTTQVLQKLDLHWNNIKGNGAKDLADSLITNNSIKVLDISWNAISSPSIDNSIVKFAEAIKLNAKLYHLDISNNCLQAEDCQTIGNALLSNSTLIGLHMDGNGAILDSKGYLKMDLSTSRTRNTHLYQRMSKKKPRNLENCWVCQQWNEVLFTIKVNESAQNVFLHTELYNYEPQLMEMCNDKTFRLPVICPPGHLKFWFSYNDKYAVSADFPVERYEKTWVFAEIECVWYNFFYNPKCSNKMWHEFYPRAQPRKNSFVQGPETWCFSVSIFNDYIMDSQQLLSQCFEYDLSMSSIPKLVQTELTTLIDMLTKSYKEIKEIYKHIAGCSKNNWKAWQENIIDLLMNLRIIDNNLLKTVEIANILKIIRNIDSEISQQLSRYQFLEMFVRMGLARQSKLGSGSLCESIGHVLKNLNGLPASYNSSEFRVKKYCNFFVDRALKNHIDWLVPTFCHHEKNRVIAFRDFIKIMAPYSRNEENIIKNCYLAKETKRYDRYYENNLKFCEYLEAFVRVIDEERVDHDFKRLKIEVLIDTVITGYFKTDKII